jgi:hypothetical protein
MSDIKTLKNSIEKQVLLRTYQYVTSPYFLVCLLVLVVILGLLFMNPAFGESSTTGAYVKHLYIESNGNLHTYGFKICAGNLDLHDAIVWVSSDSQTITISSDDTINAGKCSKTFGVQIQADDPNTIRATLIDNTYV